MQTKLTPKFAIIVPIYNTARYLSECLNSIRTQTYTNFEVYLIDDGSTDGSEKICDSCVSQDSRFFVLHKRNEGVSAARNAALELVEKKNDAAWVICLDSDDYLTSNALNTIAVYCSEMHPDMLLFGVRRFSRMGFIFEKKVFHEPLHLNCGDAFRFSFNLLPESKVSPAFSYFVGNIVFCATLIRGLRFSQNLDVGEDQDFKIKALSRLNHCVVISDLLYNYRLRRGSLSHSGNIISFNSLEIFVGWLNKVDLPKAGRPVIEERIADLWWLCLRDAVYLGKLDLYWTKFIGVFDEMRECFKSDILKELKWRKRCLIFLLGRRWVKMYFLKRKKFITSDVDVSTYFQ